MKLFKTLREEALEKVKNAKVFADKKSADNEKDSAFSKKGQEAKSDSGELEYGANKNKVHVTEDIDQAYADWQDSVKKKNPEHADKIKFKSNSDQRHVISAEHGDRSFGTFNTKTGESEHLGEALDNKAALRAKMAEHEAKALEANKQGDDEMVKHHQDKINKIKTKMANLIRNEEIELDEAKENVRPVKPSMDADTTDHIAWHRQMVKYHTKSAKALVKQINTLPGSINRRAADHDWREAERHQTRADYLRKQVNRGYSDAHRPMFEELELELDEARSLEDKIKVAKEIYAEKLKSATSPADRAQAKEDHENLIKKLSESESLDEAHEYMWKIEGGIGKGKVFGDKSTTVDDHLSAMKYHSQEYQKAVEEKRNTDAQRHGMKYHKHKDQIERLGDVGNYRKEGVELDEVSKTTLVSYIKKAARSAAEAGNEAGFKAGAKQPKYNVSDETPTEIKRHKGIALAARKLSK